MKIDAQSQQGAILDLDLVCRRPLVILSLLRLLRIRLAFRLE